MLFSVRCIINSSHWHLCHCCKVSNQHGACAAPATTLDQGSLCGQCFLPWRRQKVLGGGENCPHQSNIFGADQTWCYVVMTQCHQPTTPGAETIWAESSNHEQIGSMVSAPGGVGWWSCKFLLGTQKKLMLLSMAGSWWEIGWFGINFWTQTSTKIPL